MVFKKNEGGRLLRYVAPVAVLGTILLLCYIINDEVNYGMIALATVTGFIALGSVLWIVNQLNNADLEKKRIADQLTFTNLELTQFKYALDESSLVSITNEKGIITNSNNKFYEISKYTREELIGKTHSVVNSGFHPKSFFEDLWGNISNGDVWTGKIKNKAKDGTFFWLQTTIIPFKNEDGVIYQYLSIGNDITETSPLIVENEALKLKNKELEEFAYIASHDLQEPLRTVSSMVEVLQEEHLESLNQQAIFSLNFISEATVRMRDLIKGLLDYSRIGGNKQLEKVDLGELIIVLRKDLEVSINDKKAIITVDAMPVLNGYYTELRLLLQNLISNSLKFQKKDTYPEITLSAKDIGNKWKISIKDNGIGISEKNNKKVFTIFQRLNNRGDYEGTGIGLAHCEKIVQMHGGEIWVDSKIDEGSTFYFTISKDSI
jgi:PAS domain S-box-containing protein